MAIEHQMGILSIVCLKDRNLKIMKRPYIDRNSLLHKNSGSAVNNILMTSLSASVIRLFYIKTLFEKL